ncbi:putative protein N(5)-glutamine methyltransferase [Pengzhenrongella sicca]|uniref:putative protein N(5)-glutamine methyltransferase n=1 Tax=Pengzhenrongella sicca TaxID=2819238 RepID=UPI001D0C84FE|nr:putative protein N(5)-glutamine methyltransferase [Pengzhenrongella sicca]
MRTLRAAGCVFAEDEARVLLASARTDAELAAMVGRRTAGEPLEHIVGWVVFCGLRIAVEPGVFVPRRRTERLVREAAAVVRTTAQGTAVVADLCCGTGAVGAALAATLEPTAVELFAVDLDPAAVRCARRNVAPAGGHVYAGDLFGPLPPRLRGRVDVVVANAPYVPTDAIALLPAEARLHEPRLALDGGADGLDVQRRVVAAAPQWLTARGFLLVETSEQQAAQTVDAFARAGLTVRLARSERYGSVVAIGRRVGNRPVAARERLP